MRKFYIVWNELLPAYNKYDSFMEALMAKGELENTHPDIEFIIMESMRI